MADVPRFQPGDIRRDEVLKLLGVRQSALAKAPKAEIKPRKAARARARAGESPAAPSRNSVVRSTINIDN